MNSIPLFTNLFDSSRAGIKSYVKKGVKHDIHIKLKS